jgi:hypothetical protein
VGVTGKLEERDCGVEEDCPSLIGDSRLATGMTSLPDLNLLI